MAKRIGLAVVCGLMGMVLAPLFGVGGGIGAIVGVVFFALSRISASGGKDE
ncbi:hypothetical protein [Poseidonocella pacifica]|nr:hypothetical protein [Poseidonocella pacifica]